MSDSFEKMQSRFNETRQQALELLKSFEVKTVGADQPVIQCNRKPVHVGFLHEGFLREKLHRSGGIKPGTHTVSVYSDLQWFAIDEIFNPKHVRSYEAITTCRFSLIEANEFMSVIDETLRLSALCQYAIMHAVSRNFHVVRGESLRMRLLHVLLDLGSRAQRPEIEVTLKDIADITGSSKTKISPLMKELEEKNLVERGYKNYIVPDIKKVIQELISPQS